jgi:hypothetical protein
MRPLGDKSPVQIDMGEYNRNFLVDYIVYIRARLNKSGVKPSRLCLSALPLVFPEGVISFLKA